MVETPSATITISTPTGEPAPATKDDKEGLLETAPVHTLVHQKPITSSIRGTLRHLQANAGRLSKFRGYRIHILWAICLSICFNILDAVLPKALPLRMVLISAIGSAVCANIHAAWTHKVISMPTTEKFWKRIPGRANWKILALPAAINGAMPYVSLYIVQGLVMLFRLDSLHNQNYNEYNGKQWTFVILRFIAAGAIAICTILFLSLPAIATLIRMEASILPEDQDTIVPFDRSFGGKVVPKVLGGTGYVGFVDAWRSFNWEARRRLIKLYVKIFSILTGLFIVLAHVMAFEIFAIMGPALGKFLAQAKQQGYIS